MPNLDQIKELRNRTGISIMQCKKALEESNGNLEKALTILTKKSGEIAAKKSDRILGAGCLGNYIHNDKIGAMVILLTETDFVAKNSDFLNLAREIAMQVTATNPVYISENDISDDERNKIKKVLAEEVANKPENLREQILEGKLKSYFKDKVLLTQCHIKNSDKTIKNLIDEATQKFGEKIEISDFKRFEV